MDFAGVEKGERPKNVVFVAPKILKIENF